MTRVIVTELADADTAEILADIAREAGYRAAEKYNFRIESLTTGLPSILTVTKRGRSSGRTSESGWSSPIS